MKLGSCLILALSRSVFAQIYVSGPEYGAAYCGQPPCGHTYPGVGVGMPQRPSPCLSQHLMPCAPVPQHYGAFSCICSTSSGIYHGGEYPYPPPFPPPPPPTPPYGGGAIHRPPPPPPPPLPPPRPMRRPKCRLECVDEDYYYYYPRMDSGINWPEYLDYYHGYGHCRPVCYQQPGDRDASSLRHPRYDAPWEDRDDEDYGDGRYAQHEDYMDDLDDDWPISPGHQQRRSKRSKPGKPMQGPDGGSPEERCSDPRRDGRRGGRRYCTRRDYRGNCLTWGRHPRPRPDPVEEGGNTRLGGHDGTGWYLRGPQEPPGSAGPVARRGERRERDPEDEKEDPGPHERYRVVDQTKPVSRENLHTPDMAESSEDAETLCYE